jgi:predicted enzyme related to lactoylglutathione lyase
MGRPVHFEIHAEDPERASAFYRSIFGWDITKFEGPMAYWIVRTGEGPGIDGGILPRQGPPPADGAPVNGYVCTIAVENLDDTTKRIAAAGCPNVVPKNHLPGVGTFAYFKDTEGNIFGCIEPESV